MTTTDKPKNDQRLIDDTGRWVLFATIAASSMAFMSGSALNVALDAIQDALGASGADVFWIINSYALLLAAFLLVGGSLGDHFGRKRIYIIGIIVFTVASAAAGLSPSTEFLIITRAIQGLGGALMVPGSLAIISAYFDDKARGTAIGTWSSFTTLMSIIGPALGGILADAGLWRAIFFLNIPFALASLFALLRYVPESYDEEAPQQLDYPGAALVVLGLAGITFGALRIGEEGAQSFSNPLYLGSLIGGVLALIGFIIVEARSDHPMMPLRLFKSSTFSGANALTLFLYGALGGALLFLPLNLIQIQGYSATIAGLAGTLPFTILLVVMSPYMGRVVDRYGPRIPLTVGPVIVGFGFLAFTLPGVTNGFEDYWTTFFPPAILFGFGMGIVVAPLTTSVMGSVPQHSSGVASGVNNAMSRASQVLATAVFGGVALLVFTGALQADIQDVELSQEARATLIDNSKDLGNTEVPESIGEDNVPAIEQAIRWSFVDMFRTISLISAAMCWLSAVIAFFTIKSELKPPDSLKKGPPKPEKAAESE